MSTGSETVTASEEHGRRHSRGSESWKIQSTFSDVSSWRAEFDTLPLWRGTVRDNAVRRRGWRMEGKIQKSEVCCKAPWMKGRRENAEEKRRVCSDFRGRTIFETLEGKLEGQDGQPGDQMSVLPKPISLHLLSPNTYMNHQQEMLLCI